jgi:Fe-S-cluster containining protein
MSDVTAKRDLDALYAELPTIACQRKCHSACGPIFMSRVEWQRIIKKKGYEPRATSIDCPLLVSGLCSVYNVRPMICRLWGIVESLPCPWGCKPQPRYLTHAEGHDFLLRAELLSEPEHAEQINALRAHIAANPEQTRAFTELFTVKPRIK